MYNKIVKYFTLDEAEAQIPRLEKIFLAAREIKSKAEGKVAAIQALENLPDPAQSAIEHGQLEFLAGSLDEALKAVEKMGAALKGLDPGLVDFPHKLDGKDVYLCWTFGEKRIRFFHGLEDGFAGRRPIHAHPPHH